uniref:Alpha-tubulin N-acetyltransferase n=1 Tax=Timema bartmani TaxID=61472 RepID=A0A7R9I654_9NEOP|nr:unnamed protein product [Timema bartmani]
MGRASAIAQGLNKPITSGERLRNSEHLVYLLIDPEGAKGKGTVVGLLKVGSKNLYVYDHTGAHHEVKPLCVLDFYVHESKQRMGLGKILYEHMLKEANVLPQDLAIDKPSENFLAFLFKYYGLEHIIPQSNNYVVFDGFFADRPVMNGSAKVQSDHVKDTFDGIPPTVGRHSAFKPVSTMGAILQNVSVNPYQNDGTVPRIAPDIIRPVMKLK